MVRCLFTYLTVDSEQLVVLTVEAVSTSEKSSDFYKTVQRTVPEGSRLS